MYALCKVNLCLGVCIHTDVEYDSLMGLLTSALMALLTFMLFS